MTNIPAPQLRACADEALKAYGTATIFSVRASKLRRCTYALSFFGLLGPVLVGIVGLAYGLDSSLAKVAYKIALIVSVLQFITVIWSLVAKWDTHLAYYLESKTDNYYLSEQFARLSSDHSLKLKDFQIKFELLKDATDKRSQRDNQHDVNPVEKKHGMQAGLWKFKRQCSSCNRIPDSSIPSCKKQNCCGTCGCIL